MKIVITGIGVVSPFGIGRERFWTSGDPTTSTRVISALLRREVKVDKLPV